MDMHVVLMFAGLAFVAGILGLFLYFGLRSGRGHLIGPPRDFGKREYGQRPKIRPAPVKAAPVKAAPAKPLLAPPSMQEAAKEVTNISQIETGNATVAEPVLISAEADAPADAEPAPIWRRDRPAGHARLSENCYTAGQYAEREVKALLLQNRADRAIRHIRRALKLPAAEAEAYVKRLARSIPR